MKINLIRSFMDGGTIVVHTDEGLLAIDRRIGTKTPLAVYKDYPLDDNSNKIKLTPNKKEEFFNLIKTYEGGYWYKKLNIKEDDSKGREDRDAGSSD